MTLKRLKRTFFDSLMYVGGMCWLANWVPRPEMWLVNWGEMGQNGSSGKFRQLGAMIGHF